MQRVTRARVAVGDEVVGQIGVGLVVLLGVAVGDGPEQAVWMADKVADLRIFEGEEGSMDRSLVETRGEVLVVSQFTLLGDARKGRRPSFIRAARGSDAEALYEAVKARFAARGVACAGGRFGATMDVELVNAGPVTILLDSEKTF